MNDSIAPEACPDLDEGALLHKPHAT